MMIPGALPPDPCIEKVHAHAFCEVLGAGREVVPWSSTSWCARRRELRAPLSAFMDEPARQAWVKSVEVGGDAVPGRRDPASRSPVSRHLVEHDRPGPAGWAS